MISDQAPNMICAIKNMKNSMFPNLKHITCLCHALNGVCQLLMRKNILTKKLINSLPKYLKKKKNCRDFIEKLKIEYPPICIDIRWGSFLNSASYYRQNFDRL